MYIMKNTIESQNGNLLFLFASFYKILRCYLQFTHFTFYIVLLSIHGFIL